MSLIFSELAQQTCFVDAKRNRTKMCLIYFFNQSSRFKIIFKSATSDIALLP